MQSSTSHLRLRLREERIQQGLSIAELSQLSGVGAANISRMERGLQQPQGRTLRKLATVLKVEVAELWEEQQDSMGRVPDPR